MRDKRGSDLAILLFLVALCPGFVSAGEEDVAFTQKVKAIYSFRPSKVSEEVQKRKIAEMDAFWKLVAGDRKKYLPLLRTELKKKDQLPFFLFDGGCLLAKVSKERDDLELSASAMTRSDLDDLDLTGYFRQVHFLCMGGVSGAKIVPAIGKIIDCPRFRAIIPEHALELSKGQCVTLCVLCMDQKEYVDRFIKRLKVEKDPEKAKVIIGAIAYALTEDGRRAIEEYAKTAKDKGVKQYSIKFTQLEEKRSLPDRKPTISRKDFDRFLRAYFSYESKEPGFDPEAFEKDAPYLVVRGDFEKLKDIRRVSAQRISDEACSEIEFLTMLMQYSLTSKE